jgi:D-alanyl-D-alanine carboxypeptidase
MGRTVRIVAFVIALIAPLRFAEAADDLGQRVKAIAERAVKAGVAGAIVAVARAGKGPVIGAAGLADVGASRPFAFDTPWPVASVTKLYTAAIALQMVAEGTLGLETPIVAWLPDFPEADTITLRQLLNHSSGIADYANERFLAAAPADGTRFAPEELLGFREPTSLLFAPGTQARYSNANFLLLGRILERAAGKPFAEVLAERLLGPLRLEHTMLAGPGVPLPDGLAHGYADIDGDGDLDDTLRLPWTLGWTDNAMVADAADQVRFIRALLGNDVLPADLRTAMLVPVLERDAAGQPVAAYGLGVELMVVDGVTWVGHSGSTFGYLSGLWLQPQSGAAVVVGLNAYPEDKDLLAKLVTRAIRATVEKED